MSGFSGRRKKSFFGSWVSSIASKRRKLLRSIRLESLERRELMAADVAMHHNNIIAEDVTRDYYVTPLDALTVINELNRTGGVQALSADFDPGTSKPLLDVSGDNMLTPLDALMIVNRLNNGEGVGEVVRFKFEFLTPDGQSLDPNPNDGIEEYQIGVGQKFIFRTLVQDLRPVPDTVFSAYLDVNYVNQNGSANELAEIQWGEFDLLRIGSTTNGGSFTLQYGGETTAPIVPVLTPGGALDRDPTAVRIAEAIGNLNVVGGVENVRVESIRRLDTADATFRHFGISFINDRARTNIPDPVIAANSLTSTSGNPVALNIRGKANPTPADSEVLLTAFDFRSNNPNGSLQVPQYDQVLSGNLLNPAPGTFVLNEVGATSNQTSSAAVDDPGALFTVFDATFIAREAGTVLFSGNGPDGPPEGLEVLLLGEGSPVPESMIIFPQNIPLRIVNNLSATNDNFPGTGSPAILEDGGAVTLNVTANDILSTGTSFGITAVTQPATGGSVSFTNGGSSVVFTPAPDFFGTTTFTYTITSNLNDSSTATVTVNVAAVNDAPTVVQTTFDLTEDPASPLSLNPGQVFSPGPSNESSQTLTFVSATPIAGQTNGTVALNGGVVTYQPDANFFGTARFVVTVTDNGTTNGAAAPLQTTTTITVNVAAVNDAPTAFSGTINATEDTDLVLIGTGAPTDLLANSQKGPANEASQTLTLAGIPATTAQGGTITTAGGRTVYRPAANFFGTDTFTYTVSDNGTPNLTSTGTITINVANVNDAPDAVDDTGPNRFAVVGLSSVQESLNVLGNDSPGPNEAGVDTLRIVAVTAPSRGGTATIAPNGLSIIYSPTGNEFNVEETFTYTIEDSGGLRDTANVTVFVAPPKLPFAVNDSAIVDEDSGATTIDVLPNDLINSGATRQLISFTQPARGTVTLDDRGTATTSDDRLIFTPNADVFQPDSFTYTMSDTAPNSEPSIGTVNITIREVNDPPTAVDRTAAGVEDTTQTIPASFFLNGLSKGPLEDAQTLTLSDVTAVTANAGTVAVVNGSVVYTPAENFTGPFVFRYTVTDNGTTNDAADPKSATATVTINVAAVNDAPVPVNDTRNAVEDTPLTIAISSLLSNDRPGPESATDEQGQAVVFIPFSGVQTSPNGGTLQVAGSNLIYTPAADFNGTETFTYTVTDNGDPAGAPATVTLTIQVSEVNDPPLPVTINRVAYTNLNRVFDITAELATIPRGPANESNQTLTLTRVFANANTVGTVTLNPDGTITYTPPLNGFVGQDSFTYEVRDNGTTNGSPDPKVATGTIIVDVLPFIPSSIQGTAWVDDNNDGRIGEHELRLSGVTVTLSGRTVGESQDITPISILTLADGSYHFDDLPPGAYTVTFVKPPMLIDGPEYLGNQGGTKSNNQFALNIEAPGDVQARNYNFAVLGIIPQYGNIVENLASSFYGTHPEMRQKGLYAAVDSDGRALWTMAKDGFEGSLYTEALLSNDGTKVILTTVNANHEVYTAVVSKNKFVKVKDEAGNTLIRILALPSELTWTRVDLNAPADQNTRHYLETIDSVFAQQSW